MIAEGKKLRTELALITEWIKPNSHVLDLGCGDGTLLLHLKESRQTTGYGIEIDHHEIVQCIESGVNVIQADLNQGLEDFKEDTFDYVIMTLALQAIDRPDVLLRDMLRIGREVIVTFPNFGHWAARMHLLAGRMPISRALPNEWYNTPNIHLCSMKDFEHLCAQLDVKILQYAAVDTAHRSTPAMKRFPNLMGEVAVYRLQK
jgi:methionine biosynthesis protein MetW